MSRYQRFVAYVYEYQKQKKGNNRGFVRVENKNGICNFQIQLQCPGVIGQMSCRIYGFLRKEDGIEGVLLGKCETQRDGFQCEIEVLDGQMGNSQRRLEDFGGMIFLTEGGGFYGTEWDDREIVPEQFQEEESDIVEEKENLTADGPINFAEDKEEILETEEAQEELVLKKIREPDDWEKDEEEEGISKSDVSLTEREEEFEPFRDGEIVECKKIDLQELSFLNRRDWALRNNRFLLYGYYQFGYLIIGRMRGRQQYVLGVPGMYDQQERFMANMFGFNHFKMSPCVELPNGKGGYWYRSINPPNFDQRNGLR